MMQLFNRIEASKLIGVSPNTVESWAREKRIRTVGWSKDKPIFSQENIDEVIAERKKDKKNMPSIKEEIN